MPDLDHPHLKNRVIIMNGFANDEIVAIMKAVKSLCQNGVGRPAATAPSLQCSTGDLVFAKTTTNSLQAVLGDVIIDMGGDHAYLKANPPAALQKPKNPA